MQHAHTSTHVHTLVGLLTSLLPCAGMDVLGAGVGMGVGGLLCTGDVGEASSLLGDPLVKGFKKGLGFFSVGVRCRKGLVLGPGLLGGSEKGLNGLDDVEASSEVPFSKTTRSNCPRSPQEKCVTVTGVAPTPFSSCCAGLGVAGLVGGAGDAAAPPSDSVSLSPP